MKKLGFLIAILVIVGAVVWVVSRYTTLPKAAQNVYQSASDLSVSSKVKSNFYLSKRLSPYELKVQTSNGTVTLTGLVPSEIDKELAGQVATDTVGVAAVNNQIDVSPNLKPTEESRRASARVMDLEIKADLREKLSLSQELNKFGLGVEVQDRIVTLTGEVDTATQKLGAEQVARSISNVVDVKNNLSIRHPELGRNEVPGQPTSSPQEQELTKQVQFALFNERESFADVAAIKVATNAGVVTLTGTVRAPAESKLAAIIARNVSGVKEVRNQLAVTP